MGEPSVDEVERSKSVANELPSVLNVKRPHMFPPYSYPEKFCTAQCKDKTKTCLGIYMLHKSIIFTFYILDYDIL